MKKRFFLTQLSKKKKYTIQEFNNQLYVTMSRRCISNISNGVNYYKGIDYD